MIEKRWQHGIVAVGSFAKSRWADTAKLWIERRRVEVHPRTGEIERGALVGSVRAAQMICKNASLGTRHRPELAIAVLRDAQGWRDFARGPKWEEAVFGRVTKPSLKVRVLSRHTQARFDEVWLMFSCSHAYSFTLF